MSATIYWRQVKGGKALSHTSAPSAFQEYLESAAECPFPLRLSNAHLPALRTAYRMTKDSNFIKDLQELIEAIESHEVIEVWAEW